MPGSKHIGENDEVITSKKLNHMEYGLEKASARESGGALIVHETYGYNPDFEENVCTLDTTFMDIFNAANNGSNIYIVAHSENNERIIFKVSNVQFMISAQNETSYFNYNLRVGCVGNNFVDHDLYINYGLILDASTNFPKNGPNSYPYRHDTRSYAVRNG